MSQHEVSNSSFISLARIGTGKNPKNAVMLTPATANDVIGVSVEQESSKRAVFMELIVPISRSRKGSRRAARFSLNGKQAREVYETLNKFYTTR